jgi:hypothetical protein
MSTWRKRKHVRLWGRLRAATCTIPRQPDRQLASKCPPCSTCHSANKPARMACVLACPLPLSRKTLHTKCSIADSSDAGTYPSSASTTRQSQAQQTLVNLIPYSTSSRDKPVGCLWAAKHEMSSHLADLTRTSSVDLPQFLPPFRVPAQTARSYTSTFTGPSMDGTQAQITPSGINTAYIPQCTRPAAHG